MSRFCVGVVGGGIGGVALALALQQRGILVKVFESDVRFDCRRQGYGLTMQQAGAAIRELGIQLPETTPSKSHYVFSSDGHIVGFFGRSFRTPDQMAGTDSALPSCKPAKKKNRDVWKPPPKIRFNIHIPRQVLRDTILSKLSEGTVQWGRKLVSFNEHLTESQPDKNGVVLTFHDGTQERVSALVGADGIRSVVRRQLIGDGLSYLGVVVILGIVKSEHPLIHERIFETVDGTTRIYVMPFAPDHSMWQLSFPCDEQTAKAISANPESLQKEALARCGDWHEPVPELLSTTTPDLISGYPVYDREPLRPDQLRKVPGSLVTLLGDAAHPMSPFRGQGANQALLDAVLLASRLQTGIDAEPAGVSGALASYERSMLERSSPKALASREAAINLHTAAVQAASETVEVSGETIATGSVIQALRQEAVGSWSSKVGDGIDAAVRRVAGNTPSGCPSALHQRKMLRGRDPPPNPAQPGGGGGEGGGGPAAEGSAQEMAGGSEKRRKEG